MALKLIVFVTLLGVALAYKPYLGFNMALLDPHIVGGEEAKPGQFPEIVSLRREWIFGSYHMCGASILNKDWVVTAAHCVLAVSSNSEITVVAGKHNIQEKEATEQTSKVSQSIVHEKYSGGVAPYDIALLKLATPLKFNNRVKAIKLPKAGSVPEGSVVLAGWGSISQSSIAQMPDTLQHAELPVIDLVTCKNAVESLTGPSPLHETNVCTGPLTGGYSACSGDSGGPLISAGPNPTLIGVVSWGIIPCGTRGAPSVYTRASAFNDWIQNAISKY